MRMFQPAFSSTFILTHTRKFKWISQVGLQMTNYSRARGRTHSPCMCIYKHILSLQKNKDGPISWANFFQTRNVPMHPNAREETRERSKHGDSLVGVVRKLKFGLNESNSTLQVSWEKYSPTVSEWDAGKQFRGSICFPTKEVHLICFSVSHCT